MDEQQDARRGPGRPVGYRKPQGQKVNKSIRLLPATWAGLEAKAEAAGVKLPELLERLGSDKYILVPSSEPTA